MSKILKNQTANDVYLADTGKTVPASGSYTITIEDYRIFAVSDDTAAKIGDGTLVAADGVNTFNIANSIALIQGMFPSSIDIHSMQPFASKMIDGKKLYNRTAGKTFTVVVGVNVLEYAIPFVAMKFDGLEILFAEEGDTVNLKVLDTVTGTYKGTPNALLNQFGYDVNIVPGFYHRGSKYDADIYQGMRIVVEYTATVAKTIAINYGIHEIK